MDPEYRQRLFGILARLDRMETEANEILEELLRDMRAKTVMTSDSPSSTAGHSL